jgi:hypothetical protein
LRKKLLEERELQEWAIREEEMKKEQEDKLQVLIDTLRAREEKTQQLSEARIDKVRQEKMKERDEVFEKVNDQRIKAMRGLAKTRPHVEAKSNKRDIITEHSEYGSKVYAPVAREGRLPVKNQVVDYGIPLISNYQGLSALEQSMSKSVTDFKVRKPDKIIPKSTQGRKGAKIRADLEYVDKLSQLQKNGKPTEKIENKYKKFEPIVRAPTPSVCAPEMEEPERAVLLLQRLLRGRSMQNDMYKGKQKALHLIRELRIAEEPPVQRIRLKSEELEKCVKDTIAGEVISNALDFISKEVLRVSEERKISTMVEHANKMRRIREAEETGRRQMEDAVRRKKEQQFAMAMSVHRLTSFRFLEDLFDDALEAVAEDQANHESSNMVEPTTKVVPGSGLSEDEAVVQDLISSFLLPEVERKNDQRTQTVRNRRHVDTAYRATNAMLDEVGQIARNNWMKLED